MLLYSEISYWIVWQRFIDVSEQPTASIFTVVVLYNLLHILRRKQYSDNLFRSALCWLMLVAGFLLLFSLIGPFNKVFGHVPAVLQRHGSVLFGQRKIYVFGSAVNSAVSISKSSALRAAPLSDLPAMRVCRFFRRAAPTTREIVNRSWFRNVKGRDL